MQKSRISFVIFLIIVSGLFLTLLFCGQKKSPRKTTEQIKIKKEGVMMEMTLKSEAFAEGEFIPKKYSCEGPDVSPPLEWSPPPAGTKSLVLIFDDPDAPVGIWVHWVMYGIPPDTTSLPENVPKEEIVLGNIRQGTNDFKRIGYGGPCPPAGKPHRYYFKLYALDIESNWEPGLTKDEVLKKIDGHVLSTAQLMGKYQR